MPKPNRDRSRSRIVKMPRLHDDTMPADVWFEAGMIYFEDPRNPDDVEFCTVDHFENYLDNALWVFLNDEVTVKKFVCGRQAAWKWYRDGKELVREARNQLHVGLPLDVISEVEAGRTPVTRRQGFEPPGLLAVPTCSSGAFSQRASGLIVPN